MRSTKLLRSGLVAALVALVAAATVSPAGAAKSAGTTTITQGGTFSPATLDPALGNFSNVIIGDGLLKDAVYGMLVYYDLGSQSIKPDIAKSLTTTDATEWTLTLRSGVKFTDGTTYDANAVKFNWDRIKDPALKSPAASRVAALSSYVVTDPLTLKITLASPNSLFPHVVARYLGFIASPTALQKYGTSYGTAADKVVGAGPFVVKTWQRDVLLEFTKNPDFFRKDAPKVDVFRYPINVDDATRYNELKIGQTDLSWTLTSPWYQTAKADGLKLSGVPYPEVQVVRFNTAKPPFNDPDARQAVALALDPKQVNATLYGGRGALVKYPRATNDPYYSKTNAIPAYNKAEAQKLFDKVAAKLGGPVTIQVQVSTSTTQQGDAFTAMLAGYNNVKVTVTVVPANAFLTALAQGQYNAVMLNSGLNGSQADPLVNADDSLKTKAAANYYGISDPVIDKAIADGLSAVDAAGRKTAYLKLERALIDNNYIVFLGALPPPLTVVLGKNVQSWSPNRNGDDIYSMSVKT